MDIEKVLERLSHATGPSGFEEEAADAVRELFLSRSDDVRTDTMGNVVGLKRGKGRSKFSIMFAAHMDEIGLMVTGFEKGFLRFTTVGGLDPRVLPGQEVWVHGRERLPGLIASLPPHVLPAEQRGKVSEIHELFIDVGFDDSAVSSRVRVGDAVTFRSSVLKLAGGICAGKAMDDRAGVAALVVALDDLASRQHEWDVVAVATVQEEVGLKGALVSAYGIRPDLAIAVDVTHGDMPGVDDSETVSLTKGPSLGWGPNITPEVFDRLKAEADAHGIPWQLDPIPGYSGTDAWSMQIVREGIPTGLVSLPLRYMHTPVETLFVKNVTRTGRLLALFAAGLDQAFGDRWRDREVPIGPRS